MPTKNHPLVVKPYQNRKIMDTFSETAIIIYKSGLDCNKSTVNDIKDNLGIGLNYGYVRQVVTLVRQLQNGCFDSLPDGVQKAVIWIEDNHADEAQNKDIADKLGVSNYHIRLAKLFIAMENMGLFDEPGVYDF